MDFHTLTKRLEDAGLKPTSYSGRMMFGASCVAVICSHNELPEGLGQARIDSMGLGKVYYWPEVDWIDPVLTYTYACPKCTSHRVCVEYVAACEINDRGNDQIEHEHQHGDIEYNDYSNAWCGACNWSGKFVEATIEPHTGTVSYSERG